MTEEDIHYIITKKLTTFKRFPTRANIDMVNEKSGLNEILEILKWQTFECSLPGEPKTWGST